MRLIKKFKFCTICPVESNTGERPGSTFPFSSFLYFHVTSRGVAMFKVTGCCQKLFQEMKLIKKKNLTFRTIINLIFFAPSNRDRKK
jgi:hypothetical protein